MEQKEKEQASNHYCRAPKELTDRKVYNTPIGPVCMSKTEHEIYEAEEELQAFNRASQ